MSPEFAKRVKVLEEHGRNEDLEAPTPELVEDSIEENLHEDDDGVDDDHAVSLLQTLVAYWGRSPLRGVCCRGDDLQRKMLPDYLL